MTFPTSVITALIASLLFCGASGENSPGENCDHSQCQKGGLARFYSEISCRPVYQDGTCCPVRYDCSLFSSRNANKCHYFGEEYDIHDYVPSNKTTVNCLASCSCRGGDDRPVDFVCAQIECPELFGVRLPDPSCIRQYSKDSCCSISHYCPNNKTEGEEKIFQCEYEGKSYIKGQRFYPKDECKTCTCDEGFDGTTNGPWCHEISCSVELRSGRYLRQGCVPVFYKQHCCPVQWQCPSETDTIIAGPNHTEQSSSTEDSSENQLTCTFGSLKFDVQDKLNLGSSEKVDCSCITPPYLSCSIKTDE